MQPNVQLIRILVWGLSLCILGTLCLHEILTYILLRKTQNNYLLIVIYESVCKPMPVGTSIRGQKIRNTTRSAYEIYTCALLNYHLGTTNNFLN